MNHNTPQPGGNAGRDGPRAPLLSPETISAIEQTIRHERGPQKRLLRHALNLCRAESAVYAATVRGAAEELATAQLRRGAAHERLCDEQQAVANAFLAGLAHAAELQPADLADLMASVFQSPHVQAALVPVLERLLKPTATWLRGEQCDLAERVTGLEVVVGGEEVLP